MRGGIEVALSPAFRFGVAASSRIWTQEFDKYAGLFAEQGGFDIPPSLQAGIAFDLTPNLTLLADYRHIWFGSVEVHRQSVHKILAPFGADNGPGFGWDDVDVLKFGVEVANLARSHAARRIRLRNERHLQRATCSSIFSRQRSCSITSRRGFEYQLRQEPVGRGRRASMRPKASRAATSSRGDHRSTSHASVRGDGRLQVRMGRGAGAIEVGGASSSQLRAARMPEDRHLGGSAALRGCGSNARIEGVGMSTATAFTPIESLIGGALIGVSAVILMLFLGRVAGISGIVGRLLPPYREPGIAGAAAFLAGLIAAPAVYTAATGLAVHQTVSSNLPVLAGCGSAGRLRQRSSAAAAPAATACAACRAFRCAPSSRRRRSWRRRS